MAARLSLSRRLTFAFIPLVVLLLAVEAVCRVKFFVAHDYDWNYIVAPLVVADSQTMGWGQFMPPTTADGQIVFNSPRPCRDREVFSQRLQRLSLVTYDAFCLRGDRVALRPSRDEYRVFVLGGSTVEDEEPDGETMVDYFKQALPQRVGRRRVTVVNAGHRSYGSSRILDQYRTKIVKFSADLLLYHEAWNEQTDFTQLSQVDARMAQMQGRLHAALHYRSMLYTYVAEKRQFMNVKAVRFWKIDVDRLAENFARLLEDVRASNGRFMLVTQPINFPRYHRGVDTFDFNAVNRLIESLQSDPAYLYDTFEISALNQRLAVARQIELARKHQVFVVDILDEVEEFGDAGRKQIFTDLGHRTQRGNQVIGKLIGAKVHSLVSSAEEIH